MTVSNIHCSPHRARAAGRRTVTSFAAPRAARKDAALDWFTFFCANLQTGFGPFIAVYLTAEKWTQTDIGVVLMISGLVGLVGQVPGGILVDRARSKTFVAGVAVVAIGAAGLLTALSSAYALILVAWLLHALASCVLSPSITTVSLDLVGHERISARLGRNATFASIGSALAAAAMGACGAYFSNRAVFFVTAALALPAVSALLWLRPPPKKTEAPASKAQKRSREGANWKGLLANRHLMILALTTALFTLSNAAMLPLVGSVLTLRAAHASSLLIAACIIVPQIMVAIASPFVGKGAQSWGRRPLFLIGLAVLPLRGLCFAFTTDPYWFVPIQILDGISASVIGVLIPLVAADVTRRSGGFALAQGIVGTAMGVGAAFSSTIAGSITDKFGSALAFEGLSAIAVVGFTMAWILMPETRQHDVTQSEFTGGPKGQEVNAARM